MPIPSAQQPAFTITNMARIAGGLLAIAAAIVIAARTRTQPERLGLQDQFPT